MQKLIVFILGILFGGILLSSEVVSWFRIQEMFRFQSFHMYGVIGSAVVVGAISVFLLKKFSVKAIDGSEINYVGKPNKKSNLYGGIIFGMGWALTGACPGPLYVLLGAQYTVVLAALLSAVGGAYVYGLLQKRLPH
ncbi:MAG: YeeE/YedE thiosulfate transporter family protein [Bacteroidota bacterium]|nr:YeeE/YedE thiosulfate transporter family protein [Bacteroidota bacterium]